MTIATTQRRPGLAGQIAVVTGGSTGTGFETARRARTTAELGALSSAALDAAGPAALERFPSDLAEQIGHVQVTAAGPRSVEPGWLP